MSVERALLHELFHVYRTAEDLSAEKFLAPEVRFTGPVLRRALFEKAVSKIIGEIGGRTIPKFTSPRSRPGLQTSHYSLYRVGDYGVTISAVGEENRLPKDTDYRASLVQGLNIPFDFAPEDEAEERFDYLLLQHGKSVTDSAVPYYAKFCALDTQHRVVWRRNLFAHNIDFVREILDIRAEIDPEDAGAIELKQHLIRLERGEEAG